MLIIKDKIGNLMPGTPTMSDKYDVITGIVGDTPLTEGMIVSYDNVFTETPIVNPIKQTDKFIGVVMHQNVKVQTAEESTQLQTFKPGEVIGICIKGFVTVLADKNFNNELKIKDFILNNNGEVFTNLNDKLVLTGKIEENKKLDKKIVEVEVK